MSQYILNNNFDGCIYKRDTLLLFCIITQVNAISGVLLKCYYHCYFAFMTLFYILELNIFGRNVTES